jgi:hypothetical protein
MWRCAPLQSLFETGARDRYVQHVATEQLPTGPRAARAPPQHAYRPRFVLPGDRAAPAETAVQAASSLQKLYRASRKTAFSKVLGEERVTPGFTAAQYEAHFQAQRPATTIETATDALLANYHVDAEPANEPVLPIAYAEIRDRLKGLHASAPGSDRITYTHYLRSPHSIAILYYIYNLCLHFGRVPPEWKMAKVILIYKPSTTPLPEADEQARRLQINNWRPISLQPTIYKIFSGILASRLRTWAATRHLISPEQKAVASNGCTEHNFLLDSLASHAHLSKSDLHIAFLDISNAFGSVPHFVIDATLRHLHAPRAYTDLIHDAYLESAVQFSGPDGQAQGL